ncbi:MAG: iron-containing alcohol dehydrogenase [Tissierellia bacterium]|nr:iron-containing alcohol dehydrogenase [Tissierellia bacterium]
MFHVPTKIHYGSGVIQEIKEYHLKSLCVIADPFLLENQIFQNGLDIIEKEGISYEIFSDIIPDAPLEKIVEGVARLEENGHEAILAIGGGSALDTAKSIGFFHDIIYSQKGKVMVFAVPTTSGTGSEVSSYVVIKDSKEGIKYPLRDERLIPDVALLDTDFVMTMPKQITIDTGFDTLTHALEALVSNKSNKFSDVFAKEAIKNVVEFLPKVVEKNTRRNREKLHIAACMAGISFDQSGLGINHSLAHIIGARFGIPHGRANAILLPYVMKYNFEHMEDKKYLEVADYFEVEGFSKDIIFKNMIKHLIKMRNTLGIPNSLEKAGVNEKEFMNMLDEISAIAFQDGCTLTNPVEVTIEELKEILIQAYFGNRKGSKMMRSFVNHNVIANPSQGII